MSEREDMQALVRRGYESNHYAKLFRPTPALTATELTRIEAFCQGLPCGSRVLDLGSGSGLPFDRYLVDCGYHVTGVEFAEQMVAMARDNVPEAGYLCADMLDVALPEAPYDGVLCLYALFHLPRERHAEMLHRVSGWLAPAGRLLITLGTRAMACDTEQDWCGAPMAWSSHAPETYPGLFSEAGLEVLEQWYEGAPGDEEHHLWVLAKKCEEATC